jgi:hypothetical protein
MKKLILFGALILALSGCASSGDKAMMAPTAESAKAAIAAAKDAVKQAGKAGGVWRDTGKMIKKAEAALEKKDYAAATKLAKKAKFQGEMAEKQAMSQQNAGPWLF